MKIRGYRVEPGEIAAVLAAHPAVREAFVLAREGRLVAYVAGDPEGLRAYLLERLPEYMVPTAFVRVEALPVNASGKVDRRALPEPGRHQPVKAADPPRTPVERVVAATWQDVLEGGQIGLRDDLFELGGHSLNATQITSRLREALDVEVPLRALFRNPTVASLSSWLLDQHGQDLQEAAELYLVVTSYSDEEAEALLRTLSEGNSS